MDMKCMSQSTTKRIRPKMASPSRASASTAILEARQLRSREGRGGTRNGGTRHPGPATTVPAALRSAARSGLPPPFCQAQAPPAAGRRAVVTVTAPPRACATLGASQAVICGLHRARLRCGGLGSGCGSGCCARVLRPREVLRPAGSGLCPVRPLKGYRRPRVFARSVGASVLRFAYRGLRPNFACN